MSHVAFLLMKRVITHCSCNLRDTSWRYICTCLLFVSLEIKLLLQHMSRNHIASSSFLLFLHQCRVTDLLIIDNVKLWAVGCGFSSIVLAWTCCRVTWHVCGVAPTRYWLSETMPLVKRDVKDKQTEEPSSATVNVHLIHVWANYGQGAKSGSLNVKKLC